MLNIYELVAQNAKEALEIVKANGGKITLMKEIEKFENDMDKIEDYLHGKYDSVIEANCPCVSATIGDETKDVFVLQVYVVPKDGLREEHIGFIGCYEDSDWGGFICDHFDDSDAISHTANYLYEHLGEAYAPEPEETGSVSVRIRFCSEVTIKGDSYKDVRKKWETLKIFSDDAIKHKAMTLDVEEMTDTESGEDAYPKMYINGLK